MLKRIWMYVNACVNQTNPLKRKSKKRNLREKTGWVKGSSFPMVNHVLYSIFKS